MFSGSFVIIAGSSAVNAEPTDMDDDWNVLYKTFADCRQDVVLQLKRWVGGWKLLPVKH
jgi:hypothetical protein